MIALREGTRAPGSSRPELIRWRRSSRTRRYTGSVDVPIGSIVPKRRRDRDLSAILGVLAGELRAGHALVAALFQKEVVAVGGARVQDPVLPVGAGGHQLLAVGHPGIGQALPGGGDVTHS